MPQERSLRLRRKQTAEKLTEYGYPTTEATLATKASRGDGPPFQKYGRVPIYDWDDVLEWARSRLSKRVFTTSELDVASPKAGSQLTHK